MDELYYEIANCAFVEAHLMGEDEECARHMLADICENGNRDRVNSVIRIALAELHMSPRMAVANPHAREYVIDCVLADWLDITKPSAASRWRVKATNALTLAQRWQDPFTRRLPPF